MFTIILIFLLSFAVAFFFMAWRGQKNKTAILAEMHNYSLLLTYLKTIRHVKDAGHLTEGVLDVLMKDYFEMKAFFQKKKMVTITPQLDAIEKQLFG